MYKFINDYSEGATEEIINKLIETNLTQSVGYSEDEYCENARKLIKKECGRDDIDVHFLVGGTQTNITVIAAALRAHHAVLCPNTAHINVHESGAIEATGHKVVPIQSDDGKITSEQVSQAYFAHENDATKEHMPKPKMVYISQPSETGTLYTKEELSDLAKVCRENDLLLYLDGARLGYAFASEANDLTMADITEYCDVFYIGGTKVGALFGEAVVIKNDNVKEDFRYIIKQRGGLMAKGRLLGIQFETLFTDKLYYKIAQNAIKQAMRVKNAFISKGIGFLCDSYTNQQFPILPDKIAKQFEDRTEFWGKTDENNSCIRFVFSWATTDEAITALIEEINNFKL